MISLRKPSAEAVRAFLGSQAKGSLSYPAVGATNAAPPAGYAVDHTRIRLGSGKETFDAATAALERWEQFELGWVQAWPADRAIRQGGLVAICGRCVGLWWLNACRIVYVVRDEGPVTRFGFAYGTLAEHAGSGEERFLVEWNREDDSVWYDLLAFSRPHQLLVRLGRPWLRHIQKRFGRESAAKMVQAAGVRSPAVQSLGGRL